MFNRIMDLFARPITGVPGAYVDVLMRTGEDNSINTRALEFTGEVRRVCSSCSSPSSGIPFLMLFFAFSPHSVSIWARTIIWASRRMKASARTLWKDRSRIMATSCALLAWKQVLLQSIASWNRRCHEGSPSIHHVDRGG